MSFEECDGVWSIWLMFYTPIATICLLTTFPIIYHFVKLQTQKDSTPKILFSFGFAFLISSCLMLMTITFNMFLNIAGCNGNHHQSLFSITDITMPLLYISQLYLLLLVFFVRLYYVFHGTIFALSASLIKIYTTIYGAVPSFFFFTAIWWYFDQDSVLILVAVITSFSLIIILIISMAVLFTYKLVQVYKRVGSDESLIAIITKTTILTLVSIALTILSPVFLVISMSMSNVHIIWISNFMILLDVYTNFICVVLCYRYYNKHYLKICGCLDRKCNVMWQKMVGVHDAKNMMKVGKGRTEMVIHGSATSTVSNSAAHVIRPNSPKSSAESVNTITQTDR